MEPYQGIQGAEKITLSLLEAADHSRRSLEPLRDAVPDGVVRKTDDGLLVELVVAEKNAETLAAIAKVGANAVYVSEHHDRVTVEVQDHGALLALAQIDSVLMVMPAYPAATSSAGTRILGGHFGEAARAMEAVSGIETYGLDGSGVMIGILSDSFAATGSVFDPETTTITQTLFETNLEVELVPGIEYTLIVQSDEAGAYDLAWTSTVDLLPLPAAPPGSPAICVSRLALEGLGETGRYQSSALGAEDFIGGSCAPDSAGFFTVFGFQVAAAGTAIFNIEAINTDRSFYISLRTDCETRLNEVCAEPEDRDILPTLIGAKNQDSGHLPERIILLEDFPGGSDEGAAMAELIYAVAPGAEQAFHTAFVSAAGFADGIRRLAEIGASVIVDDVFYFAEPVYQTGIIANAVEEVTAPRREGITVFDGVSYFSAAGNNAHYALRQQYQDVNPGNNASTLPPSGNNLHRWPHGNGYLPITMPPNSMITAYLHWNQPSQSLAGGAPGVGAKIDLDMFLTLQPSSSGLHEAFGFVAAQEGRRSTNTQGNSNVAQGDPLEVVSYVNRTGQEQTVYLAINHFAGSKSTIPQMDAPLEFTVIFFDHGFDVKIQGIDPNNPASGGPAIWGHPVAEGAIAVGAINYFDTPHFDTSFGPTNEIDPQWFSSKGGSMRLFFDHAGNQKRRTVFKPDIAAVDAINTTFFVNEFSSDFDLDGFPNFFGTSAAAPNAAAIAALLRQLNPTLNSAQIKAAIQETAIDVKGFRAAPGVDDVTGHGLINGTAAMDFVAERFGIGVGPPAPNSLLFAFADEEGWTFEAPGGFTAPGSAATGQGLLLTATDNVNTLGWWRSPVIMTSAVDQPHFLTINGFEQGGTGTGTDQIYRVAYTVSSTAGSQSATPQFRMRAATWNWERVAELTVTSTGDGSLSPAMGLPAKSYRQYFTLPETQTRFRLFFDIIGLNPGEEDGAGVLLEEVLVQSFHRNALVNSQLESLQFFSGNSRGWSRRGASSLGSVSGAATSTGLRIGPVSDPSRVSFGFWGSPESSPAVHLRRGRLYRAIFRVTSDVPADDRDKVPAFRVRANDSSNKLSALLHINSSSTSAEIPAAGEARDYHLYFESRNELTPEAPHAGNAVNFSFDYLFVPGSGNNPAHTVTLDSLRIDSFQAPVPF